MKATKIIKLFTTAIIFAIAVISFTACGDEDENNDDKREENTWNDNSSNNNKTDDKGNDNENVGTSISQYDISSNVTVSAKPILEEYGYEIKIESNLSKKFPNKTFKYGVVCGYEGYDYCKYYTISEEATEYECVFIDADGVEYGWYGVIYWKSLVALRNKEAAGETLSKDEKDLQREIMQIFRKDGYHAKTHYKGKIFVEYNDKRFFLKSFGCK